MTLDGETAGAKESHSSVRVIAVPLQKVNRQRPNPVVFGVFLILTAIYIFHTLLAVL